MLVHTFHETEWKGKERKLKMLSQPLCHPKTELKHVKGLAEFNYLS